MSHTAEAMTIVDTDQLAVGLSHTAGRCLASGLDPDAYRGVLSACFALAQRPWRGTSAQWRDDQQMFGEVEELHTAITAQIGLIDRYTDTVSTRLAAELAKDEDDRNTALIADCKQALRILHEARPQFEALAAMLATVHDDTRDTYQAAYALVDQGRVMPYDGRFVAGQNP
ncbi:hypothetical protein [Actinomadura violacea]|uniref:Uncharacterized protein n=1 Tax=Actinomadura violacea TaxID=2819934 RepID=A0ABS3RXY9_9ACTN|nr:hypothetical protein [Actinomadura violacea]MBO2461636.1 hypothetical protein [Actinomadura violacea]